MMFHEAYIHIHDGSVAPPGSQPATKIPLSPVLLAEETKWTVYIIFDASGSTLRINKPKSRTPTYLNFPDLLT